MTAQSTGDLGIQATPEQGDPAPQVDPRFAGPDGGLDPQKLYQSYKELESRLGQQAQPQTPQPSAAPQEPQGDPSTQDSLRPYLSEFRQYSRLSEASKQAMAKQMGIPAPMAEQMLRGHLAQRQVEEARILQEAGLSRDDLRTLHEWARNALDPVAVQRFNRAVESGDSDMAIQAIQNLVFQRQQATQGGQLQGRPSSSAGGPQPFKSMNEVTAAMGSKTEYGKDPAYTAEVDARLAVTDNLDFQTRVVDRRGA